MPGDVVAFRVEAGVPARVSLCAAKGDIARSGVSSSMLCTGEVWEWTIPPTARDCAVEYWNAANKGFQPGVIHVPGRSAAGGRSSNARSQLPSLPSSLQQPASPLPRAARGSTPPSTAPALSVHTMATPPRRRQGKGPRGPPSSAVHSSPKFARAIAAAAQQASDLAVPLQSALGDCTLPPQVPRKLPAGFHEAPPAKPGKALHSALQRVGLHMCDSDGYASDGAGSLVSSLSLTSALSLADVDDGPFPCPSQPAARPTLRSLYKSQSHMRVRSLAHTDSGKERKEAGSPSRSVQFTPPRRSPHPDEASGSDGDAYEVLHAEDIFQPHELLRVSTPPKAVSAAPAPPANSTTPHPEVDCSDIRSAVQSGQWERIPALILGISPPTPAPSVRAPRCAEVVVLPAARRHAERGGVFQPQHVHVQAGGMVKWTLRCSEAPPPVVIVQFQPSAAQKAALHDAKQACEASGVTATSPTWWAIEAAIDRAFVLPVAPMGGNRKSSCHVRIPPTLPPGQYMYADEARGGGASSCGWLHVVAGEVEESTGQAGSRAPVGTSSASSVEPVQPELPLASSEVGRTEPSELRPGQPRDPLHTHASSPVAPLAGKTDAAAGQEGKRHAPSKKSSQRKRTRRGRRRKRSASTVSVERPSQPAWLAKAVSEAKSAGITDHCHARPVSSSFVKAAEMLSERTRSVERSVRGESSEPVQFYITQCG